ncbi:MAG: Maf-like protein, partial [Chloroflexi bacterium]|nr:Maf-like protein [Chloroflexota bacterium]
MTNAYSPRIVLASASPRRRELLAALGLPFDVVPSDADETVDALTAGGGATHVAEVLALRKARAVADVHPGARVIGSDTVVVLDGRLLGKPVDAGDARAMLLALRGRAHEVVTGVAVLSEGRELVAHERTVVTMRPYSEQEIEA